MAEEEATSVPRVDGTRQQLEVIEFSIERSIERALSQSSTLRALSKPSTQDIPAPPAPEATEVAAAAGMAPVIPKPAEQEGQRRYNLRSCGVKHRAESRVEAKKAGLPPENRDVSPEPKKPEEPKGKVHQL